MKSHEIRRDDMASVYAGLAGLAAVLLYAFWHMAHTEISYYALQWAWHQLAWVEWALGDHTVKQWRREIAKLAASPASVDLATLIEYLNKAGLSLVWIPICLSIRGLILAARHPGQRTRRRITAAALPAIMSKHSPAVIPALYYGDLLDTDPIEHRSSLNPEDWAARHGVLINGALNRTKCLEVLTLDLGSPVSGLHEMAPHEQALFAVFGSRLLAGGKDHDVAQQLLDQLNRSCHSGTWKGKRGYPDLTLTSTAFVQYAAHHEAARWLAKHPYPRTLLHAMHKEALAFGRLPSSHFRWLKGMDRTLWYALNTTGRKAPFVESSAVFTQTLWESFAFDSGYRLTEPCLENAVDGIEAYLAKIGLLSNRTTRGVAK